MKILLPFLMFLSAPAAAQSVSECGPWAAAAFLAEPWEDNIATYANGDIRLALLDMTEPAAAAVHLMILSPPFDEIGLRQCRVISLEHSATDGGWPSGFLDLDFAARQVSYDPAAGLVVTMPVAAFNPDGGEDRGELTVIVNQSTGEIRAEVAGS